MTEAREPDEQEASPEDPESAAPEPIDEALADAEDTSVTASSIRPPAPPRPFDAPPEEPPTEAEPTAGDDEEPVAEILEHSDPEAGEPFDDLSSLPALLEALLFVADHPLDEGYLARALEVSTPRIRHALEELALTLREQQRGIRLQTGPDGVLLVSAPEAAAQVERFLGLEANRRLSTAALETLAIIAYRQPITRGQVDSIRGVSSDGAIQTLRARGLIEAAGHAAGPGRPMLFRTSQRFLEHFGLERPGQLPPLPEDVELPAAEISEQLGLDEALVEQVLAEATAPEPEPVEEDAEAAEHTETGGESEPASDDLDQVEENEDVTAPEAGDTSDADVEIPRDLDALTSAAEQAFSALASPPAEEPDTETRVEE